MQAPHQGSSSCDREGDRSCFRGFKNFLLQGNVVVIAVGLIVGLAFSMLITAFTTNIIDPTITRIQGKNVIGLGIQLGQAGNPGTFLNFGAFISAIIYFAIFIAVVCFLIVVPYKTVQARRGITVFGDPPPVKTCPACLCDDLPVGALKCKYCGHGAAASSGLGLLAHIVHVGWMGHVRPECLRHRARWRGRVPGWLSDHETKRWV